MSAAAYTYTFHKQIPINSKIHLSSSHFVTKHRFCQKSSPMLL